MPPCLVDHLTVNDSETLLLSQYFNSWVCIRALSTLNIMSGGSFSFRIKVIVAGLSDGGSSPLL